MLPAERLRRACYPLIVLAANLIVAWRLFRTEYLDQMPSIEGAFLSLATYIRGHWPGYDWFPLWYGGFPFSNAYQPLFHYAVAVAGSLSGASTARAYHFMAGVGYALGGVGFYFLARALMKSRGAACLGALVFSLFSPSLLLLSNARADAGGLWRARRLQAMVVYGEMPNITGLTIGLFALALLIRALDVPRGWRWFAAAVCLAAVPATNWPATMALLLAIACYLAALNPSELRVRLPRLTVIGGLTIGLAAPFALPATILTTFHNANRMGDGPTAGTARWVAFGIIVLCCAIVRLVAARASRELRFALVYSVLFLGIVIAVQFFGVRVLPQAFRFHVAMEIALVLLGTVALSSVRCRQCVAIAVALFCATQLYHYMRYARAIVRPLKIETAIEYQEAKWFDANMHGARVLAPGSISFWMNSWTETPQMAGCCEQSLLSDQNFIEAYITGAGHQDEAQSFDYSLLWMKAWAVNAVSVPGPHSREAFRTVLFPARYEGRLPLMWRDGDDSIYRVPERVPGLARVVPSTLMVKTPPENGIDVKQLRPFAAALDDASLPEASWAWRDANSGTAHARMTPEQSLSISINYHAGWTASVNGRAIPVEKDGLGLIAVQPGCNGDCQVDLHWSPGNAPFIVGMCAGLAVAAGIGISLVRRPA